ncbi:unnamed protein product [Gordionus sp. m RMFG-2023]
MAAKLCSQMISLQKLFYQIAEERKKMHHKNRLNSFWTTIFQDYIIDNGKLSDDLIFYVEKQYDVKINVLRRGCKMNHNLYNDPYIDWEETVYLNLILQQFEYTITCSVCIRTGPKDLQILKRHSHSVFASPSKRRMDIKGEKELITYPNIFFTVDNYEEIFKDIKLKEGEIVCVELVGRDKEENLESVLFLGAVKYEILKYSHQKKACTKSKFSKRFSLSTNISANNCLLNDMQSTAGDSDKAKPSVNDMLVNFNKVQFIKMKGPDGLGQAEMAISFAANDSDTICGPPSQQTSSRYYSKHKKRQSSLFNSAPVTPRGRSPENIRVVSIIKQPADTDIKDPIESGESSSVRKRLSGSLLNLGKILMGRNNDLRECASKKNEIDDDSNLACSDGAKDSTKNWEPSLKNDEKNMAKHPRRRFYSQSSDHVGECVADDSKDYLDRIKGIWNVLKLRDLTQSTIDVGDDNGNNDNPPANGNEPDRINDGHANRDVLNLEGENIVSDMNESYTCMLSSDTDYYSPLGNFRCGNTQETGNNDSNLDRKIIYYESSDEEEKNAGSDYINNDHQKGVNSNPGASNHLFNIFIAAQVTYVAVPLHSIIESI